MYARLWWGLRMVLSLLLQGIMCSGVAYYVQGIVIKDRGPVFVTAFSPLCMILVTVLGSFILSEVVTLGRYVYVSDPRSTTFIHHWLRVIYKDMCVGSLVRQSLLLDSMRSSGARTRTMWSRKTVLTSTTHLSCRSLLLPLTIQPVPSWQHLFKARVHVTSCIPHPSI